MCKLEKSLYGQHPLPSYVKLSFQDCPKFDDDEALMDKVPYSSAIGSLMYVMIATHPDIAFTMRVVSHYMSNPSRKHWDAVKGAMQYLHDSKDMCICFGGKDASVVGYTDANYARDLDKRRSTSGYVFTFTGDVVSWSSRRQDTEAKYGVASKACKEAIWLACLVGDLDISVKMSIL